MIFEDRKFADIGNTVRHQYADGVHHIASWSHITNAHPLPGDGIVEGLKHVGMTIGTFPEFSDRWLCLPRGLLLLAEMSSKGSLATGEYTKQAVAMAQRHPDFVIGFIAGRRLIPENAEMDFITMSPGVQVSSTGDALGQQYRHPDQVVRECGSDVIIVGRGILEAPDRVEAARMYQQLGWKAYEARLQDSQ